MGLLLIENAFLPHAEAIVESAKTEVLVSTFKLQISDKHGGDRITHLFKRLIEKAKEGVKVKVLLNWHPNRRCVARSNYPAAKYLQQHGIEVRHLKDNRCCHAKIFCADKKQAIVGSHNLSIKSCTENFEISYLIQNEDEATAISRCFLSSFGGAEKI